MRATTPRKQAMRTLWHAGRYLEAQYRQSLGHMRSIDLAWGMNIIRDAYNQVLGEPDGKPLQRTA